MVARVEILSHGGQGLHKIRFKAQEVLEGIGKDDRVSEKNSSCEKERRKNEKGKQEPSFILVQPRGNKKPHLAEDQGCSKKDSSEKRDFDVHEKSFRKPRENKLLARSHCALQGLHEQDKEALLERVSHCKADPYADKANDQTLSQLGQMLCKGHLSVFVHRTYPVTLTARPLIRNRKDSPATLIESRPGGCGLSASPEPPRPGLTLHCVTHTMKSFRINHLGFFGSKRLFSSFLPPN